MGFLGYTNEAERLDTLQEYATFDSQVEQSFQDLVLLAAQICDTPIALINLINGESQLIKAKVGLDVTEFPKDFGFCPICLQLGDVLIIPDALADERFATAKIVVSAHHIRFYLGIPLIDPRGQAIGTLCVLDYVPREVTSKQLTALKSISRLVVNQLEIGHNLATLELANRKYQQVQEALHQSKCTIHSFYESAPMMMGIVEIVDNDIVHISDNPTTAKFMGMTPEAMQNCLARELGIEPKYLKQWINHYRQAELTQAPVKFEYAHDTDQGKIWISATVSAIAKNDHSRQQFAYIAEDITERKQAEEQLRWKEALLRSMNSVSPLAFYVVDNRTDEILYFNDRFCEIWGLGLYKEQMETKEFKNQDIIPHCINFIVDVPAFAASCQPLQDENNRVIVEDEIPFTDGRIIRRFSTQIRDIEDKYFGRLYIFEDITARKQAEQQIREQAALLDITTDAIIVLSLEHKILLWNKSAEKIYGWKAAEAINKYAYDIYKNNYLKSKLKIYQIVLQSGSWQGELTLTTKSGAEIIVESRWILVKDENSQPKSILIVDRDITEKKQLEKQFLRAQRMESIGTLASGIAHDLNNVLSPILMSVHLLKSKNVNPQTQRILSIVESNAQRGGNLVNQVLSFARGIEGDRTIVQIKHLILEMCQIIEQTFPKTITINTKISPNILPVYGDSTQLHQVLINLCLNARDAMPNGGNLTITAENIFLDEVFTKIHLDAKIGNYILFKVIDTGVGIPNNILDRIFEPFFTTKEFSKGTGLGLSTVVGIVKKHDGFIAVSSHVDKGTEFAVYLPAVETTPNQSLDKIETPPVGNGEWILLVEDEVAIREFTTISLEHYNYKVIAASDGVTAISLYTQNQEKINTAIIDIVMPNMDGFSTIHALHDLNPQLKIIAVSGLANRENFTTIKNTVFLPKPFTVQELLKTLNTVKSQVSC
jgi:PAS domain S-box-containing protein